MLKTTLYNKNAFPLKRYSNVFLWDTYCSKYKIWTHDASARCNTYPEHEGILIVYYTLEGGFLIFFY